MTTTEPTAGHSPVVSPWRSMVPSPILSDYLKQALPVVANADHAAVARAVNAPYLTLCGYQEGLSAADAETIKLFDPAYVIRTPFDIFRFCFAAEGRSFFGLCERDGTALNALMWYRQDGVLHDYCWRVTFHHAELEAPADVIFSTGHIYSSKTHKEIDSIDADTRFEQDNPDIGSDKYFDGLTAEDRADRLRKLHHLIDLKKRAIVAGRSSVEWLDGLTKMVRLRSDGVQIKLADGKHSAFYGLLMVMAYEYLAPHNFLARVTPDKDGKSVQWKQAREHYTVIHRHHAANNAAVHEGQTIEDRDSLKRLAHSRRAHTRLLSSAKFRRTQGQRVWVKATWVGPKEWRDTAGQIYEIVDKPAA